MHINNKLPHRPPSPPWNLWTCSSAIHARWGRELEPCLGRMGNLNRNCQVFPEEEMWYIFKWRCLQENWQSNPALGWGIWAIFWPRRARIWINQSSKVQFPRKKEILKLQIDQCISIYFVYLELFFTLDLLDTVTIYFYFIVSQTITL